MRAADDVVGRVDGIENLEKALGWNPASLVSDRGEAPPRLDFCGVLCVPSNNNLT